MVISSSVYHEFLGHFMNQFTSFGVAGAHGKTSTTGLLSHAMKNITDTSYLIGDGTGRGSANAQYFVFEADEYERHFMPYHPAYSIITNIDFDHPDYFTSLEDVFNAFNDYAKQITKGLFIYGEDAELRKITSDAPIYYYGFEAAGNDFVASELSSFNNWFNLHRSLPWTRIGSIPHPNLWSSQYHECDSRYWSSLHSRI